MAKKKNHNKKNKSDQKVETDTHLTDVSALTVDIDSKSAPAGDTRKSTDDNTESNHEQLATNTTAEENNLSTPQAESPLSNEEGAVAVDKGQHTTKEIDHIADSKIESGGDKNETDVLNTEEQEEEQDEEEADEEEEEEDNEEEYEDEDAHVIIEQLTNERDTIKNQYNTLLSKISGMKTVFQEMQNSKRELVLLKDQIHEYETQNLTLKNKVSSLNSEKNSLNDSITEYSDSLEQTKNALKKKDEIANNLQKQLQKKEDTTDQELAAMKIIKKDLMERNEELRMLLENSKKDTDLTIKEKEDLASQIEELKSNEQNLKQEIETLEKQNVDISDKYIEYEKTTISSEAELKMELESYKNEMSEKDRIIEKYSAEIEKLKGVESLRLQFEEESKNKSLQLGKLKHEAIILNEHLTKALSMLKKSSDSDNVDKQLISNLFISFVSIPRGDTKKFEVLELIASFLNWDQDQKTQAGLLHGAGSLNSVGSSSNLAKSSKTESFVSMWTDFLQKESDK